MYMYLCAIHIGVQGNHTAPGGTAIACRTSLKGHIVSDDLWTFIQSYAAFGVSSPKTLKLNGREVLRAVKLTLKQV